MGIQNSILNHPWHVPLPPSYGKACHLPVEIEYKAWWAMKKLNLDMGRAGRKRLLDINELEELMIRATVGVPESTIFINLKFLLLP